MVFEEQALRGVYIVIPNIFYDERGSFFESFKDNEFEKKLNCKFVQDNEVFSEKVNTLRGLHYQIENPQAKLIHVVYGAIKDVIVDVRVNSRTFGESFSVNLDNKNHKMLFIPGGFAHGYLVLKPNTIVHYKCTDYYHPEDDHTLVWNDPDVAIDWPLLSSKPLLSEKDASGRRLDEIPLYS